MSIHQEIAPAVSPSSTVSLQEPPVGLRFERVTEVAEDIENLSAITDLSEEQKLIHQFITDSSSPDPKDPTELIGKLKDDHFFTKENAEQELKDAFTRLNAGKTPTKDELKDQKSIAKALSKGFDSVEDGKKFEMKKTEITTWVIGIAFFALSVLFVIAGFAFPPMLPLGILGGALCAVAGIAFFAHDYAQRTPENAYRRLVNAEVDSNTNRLREANTEANTIQKEIDNASPGPEADEWAKRLTKIRTDIKKFAKENTAADEIEKGEGADREASMKSRKELKEQIDNLTTRLNALHKEVDPGFVPGVVPTSISVTPKAGTPSQSSVKDWIFSELNNARTPSSTALIDEFLESVNQLSDEQAGLLVTRFGGQENLVGAVSNFASRDHDDDLDEILKYSLGHDFNAWLKKLHEELVDNNSGSSIIIEPRPAAPPAVEPTHQRTRAHPTPEPTPAPTSQSSSVVDPTPPAEEPTPVAKPKSKKPASAEAPAAAASSATRKVGSDPDLFLLELETMRKENRKYNSEYIAYHNALTRLKKADPDYLNQLITKFGNRHELMKAIDHRIERYPQITPKTLYYKKNTNFDVWLDNFYADLTRTETKATKAKTNLHSV